MPLQVEPQISLPRSRLAEAEALYGRSNKQQRFGQFVYNFLNLHKVVQYKDWCDKLYNAPDKEAKKMLETVTDYLH